MSSILSPLRRTVLALVCIATAGQAADPFIEVGKDLAKKLKDNAVAVVASNDEFTDPAEGVGKKLRVEYTVDGAAGVRTVGEGGLLALAAAPGKTLAIVKATYGDLPDQDDRNAPGVELAFDVSPVLKAAVQNGRLDFKASNDNLGGDPAYGAGKRLRIAYTVGGVAKSVTVWEEADLHLPADGDGTGPMTITAARYGVLVDESTK